jgi:broad-specificity NMP kinase
MAERIAIAGGPKTGKTTLSGSLGGCVRHTDDLIEKGWSEASLEVSKWFDDHIISVIEGVAVPRALRKWLQSHPSGKPVDKIIYLHKSHATLKPGQVSMAKGCLTVFNEIRAELKRRGVVIEDRR